VPQRGANALDVQLKFPTPPSFSARTSSWPSRAKEAKKAKKAKACAAVSGVGKTGRISWMTALSTLSEARRRGLAL
jgi:hypothetical protein